MGEFLSFADAKEFVHKLGLKKKKEWIKYCRSGKKPKNIPTNVYRKYKNEWISWSDWLTGIVASQKRQYRTFEEAREFVHGLGLKNIEEWKEYCKSRKKPEDIPINPDSIYESNWKDWGDWLASGYIATKKRKYLPFEEAREFVRSLGLKKGKWDEYCRSGDKPQNIPYKAPKIYKKIWKGWSDWLGTEFRSFEEARQFVHNLKLKSWNEWDEYCRSGDKPQNIPASPSQIYKNDWKGIWD